MPRVTLKAINDDVPRRGNLGPQMRGASAPCHHAPYKTIRTSAMLGRCIWNSNLFRETPQGWLKHERGSEACLLARSGYCRPALLILIGPMH